MQEDHVPAPVPTRQGAVLGVGGRALQLIVSPPRYSDPSAGSEIVGVGADPPTDICTVSVALRPRPSLTVRVAESDARLRVGVGRVGLELLAPSPKSHEKVSGSPFGSDEPTPVNATGQRSAAGCGTACRPPRRRRAVSGRVHHPLHRPGARRAVAEVRVGEVAVRRRLEVRARPARGEGLHRRDLSPFADHAVA